MTDVSSDVQDTTPQTPADSMSVDANATPQTPAPAAAEGNRSDWFKSLPPEAQAEITDLRKESAEWRKKTREAEAQRKAEEAARLQQEQQALAEQGKFKELADQRAKEVETLRPRAERVEELESALRDTIQARIDALPEQWRDAVPEFENPVKTLKWLDANLAKFAAPRPPQTDAGQRGDQKPTPEVTPQMQTAANIAAQYGFTVDPSKIAERAKQLAQTQRTPTTGGQ